MTAALADLAADLASAGYAVFPVLASKVPATPHGFKDAVSDPTEARALFRRYPAPLIGVATGEPSEIDVLDLDGRNGGGAWWCENRHRIPATRTHRTRSGGVHLLFKHHLGLGSSASRIAPGVDTRGAGGYVIWWPDAGLPVLSDAPLADWPRWLLDALQPPPKPRADGPVRVPDDRQMAALVRLVANSTEGNRNRLAYWAGCRCGEAVQAGFLGEAAAVALITSAAVHAGLPEAAARATAASGVAAGRGGARHG